MNIKKILIIIFAILFLLSGFGLGIWLAYKKEKQKQFAQAIPVQSALLLRQKMDKGEWDEKTLILENLKILTGEKTPEEVYGVSKTTLPHITNIRRHADKFLKESQDEKAKEEIRKRLKKLFPDFSKPTAQHHKKNLELISTAYADERRCFEELCFEAHSFEGGGYTNHLYIEESVGSTPEFIQAVSDAITDSLNTYQGLGLRGRRAVVVVMPRYHERPSVEASAAMESFLGETLCLTHVWGAGVGSYNTEGAAYFKQVLAHEVFHCFQGENFPRQFDGPSIEATNWWVEGTADYFSNVVYPSTNAEYIFDGDFDANSVATPLYRMSYEANVFWQDFANQSSDTAILALIAALPSSGGYAEQQAAIAGLSSMPDIFHHFAEHYLDGKIRDTSGANRSLNPNWGATEEINDPRTLRYETEPFVIGRKKLHFNPHNQLFNIRINEIEPGQYSAQKEGENTWALLPNRIGRTSCSESEDSSYKVAQTKVFPTAQTYTLELQISDEGEAIPPPDGVDPNSRDRCLLGNWELDPTSDYSALASVLATIHEGVGGANINIVSFNINSSGCFMNDGRLAAQMDYSTQVYVSHPKFNYTMTLSMNTQALGSYAAATNTLHFWNFSYPNFEGTATVTGGGFSNTRAIHPGVPKPVDIKYNCSGDRIQIEIPTPPYPWVTLRKRR